MFIVINFFINLFVICFVTVITGSTDGLGKAFAEEVFKETFQC